MLNSANLDSLVQCFLATGSRYTGDLTSRETVLDLGSHADSLDTKASFKKFQNQLFLEMSFY